MDDNQIDFVNDNMQIDGGLHFFQYLSWKSLIDIFRKDRATESEDSEARSERNQDYYE